MSRIFNRQIDRVRKVTAKLMITESALYVALFSSLYNAMLYHIEEQVISWKSTNPLYARQELCSYIFNFVEVPLQRCLGVV